MVFDNMRERSSQLSNAFLSFVRTSITFFSMSSREMVTLFSDEKSRFKANTMTVDVSRATMWIKFLMHNQKIRMPQGLSQWENVCWELWLYFKSKIIWIGFLGCSLIIINNITQLLHEQWTYNAKYWAKFYMIFCTQVVFSNTDDNVFFLSQPFSLIELESIDWTCKKKYSPCQNVKKISKEGLKGRKFNVMSKISKLTLAYTLDEI